MSDIDFQLPENRWAAQMACDEANAIGGNNWQLDEVDEGYTAIYALALRILRTEKAPVDPCEEAIREAFRRLPDEWDEDVFAKSIMASLGSQGFEIAALKERGA